MTNDEQRTLKTPLIGIVSDIVSSYVANNPVRAADLASLIETTYAAIYALANDGAAAVAPQEKLVPAVAVKKSVNRDHLVCLEDGLTFKSLKRHLGSVHDMTPEQYRQKWSLPVTYPMVAPEYAAHRSALAKKIGLGAGGRSDAASKPEATRGRGRPRKTG